MSSAELYANNYYFAQVSTDPADRNPLTGGGLNANASMQSPHLKAPGGYDFVSQKVLNLIINAKD
ncbi:hypothetical protein [Sodalis ligni]|uniref:hypothetical protein n=1 Tax=Sodalis ligni TaxID=2697027 RepID=UPI00104A7C83|nr:hypothetical protein [Sodalis ligni]